MVGMPPSPYLGEPGYTQAGPKPSADVRATLSMKTRHTLAGMRGFSLRPPAQTTPGMGWVNRAALTACSVKAGGPVLPGGPPQSFLPRETAELSGAA